METKVPEISHLHPETAADHALVLTGVSKRYGAMMALDGVDLAIPQGQVTALLGENGAGKSTLVKVLSGSLVPDAGQYAIAGHERSIAASARQLADHVSVVQQEGSLVPTLTVAENIFLGGASPARTWARRGLLKGAVPFLQQVGLADLDPDTIAGELSVAEQQLVEIARLLARDAPVLVFDEPTASLSDVEIAKVISVIRGLTAAGRAVVYVTHRLGEVFELATTATVLRNGKVAASLSVADTDVEGIVTLMLGRELDVLFPERATIFGEPALEAIDIRAEGLAGDVSLSVRHGEILGLAGQLGSGNAIAIRAMAGNVQLESGSIRIEGVPQAKVTDSTMREASIAFCSDDRKRDGFFGLRSVINNLSAASLSNITRFGWLLSRTEYAKGEKLARKISIATTRLTIPVGALSGGNQQKVVLGKWIASEPTVLLIDEPTRGVDVGARAEIYRLIRELSSGGMAVVICSSDLTEILGLCDTVATFYRGQVVSIAGTADTSETRATTEVTHGPASDTVQGRARA